MSSATSVEGLRHAAFLSIPEGIQLVHLLHPDAAVGTVVQLIAARPGEGTSALARDLALIAVREVGLRALLLDIDGTGRKQADWVRETHPVPLTVAGTISARHADIVVFRVGASGLHVAEPHGEMPIAAPAWPGVLKLLRARFDLVLVDCPPLARAYDGVVIAPHVDGSLLVIEAESTRATQVQTLHDRLVEIGGKVVGSVLNKRRFHIPQAVYDRV